MPRTYSHLTPADIDRFLTHGWISVPQSIDPKYLTEWLSDLWPRVDMDPNDQSTWHTEYLKLPRHREARAEVVCPDAWAKMLELVGGEEMVDDARERWFGDQLILNFGSEATERSTEVRADYRQERGWHCDNDWYRCFLDSSNNALTVILCFTDIPARGGGTVIAEESLKLWCEHLLAHPEGLDSTHNKQTSLDMIAKCNRFAQIEAKAGDVVITHSFLLHAQTPNYLRYARAIANPHVNLKEPYNLDRPDGDYTLCEQLILNALGRTSIPPSIYTPTRPREIYYPNASYSKRARVPGELQRMIAAAQAKGLGADSVDSVYLRGEEEIREHERRNGYDRVAGPGSNAMGIVVGERQVVDVSELKVDETRVPMWVAFVKSARNGSRGPPPILPTRYRALGLASTTFVGVSLVTPVALASVALRWRKRTIPDFRSQGIDPSHRT